METGALSYNVRPLLLNVLCGELPQGRKLHSTNDRTLAWSVIWTRSERSGARSWTLFYPVLRPRTVL